MDRPQNDAWGEGPGRTTGMADGTWPAWYPARPGLAPQAGPRGAARALACHTGIPDVPGAVRSFVSPGAGALTSAGRGSRGPRAGGGAQCPRTRGPQSAGSAAGTITAVRVCSASPGEASNPVLHTPHVPTPRPLRHQCFLSGPTASARSLLGAPAGPGAVPGDRAALQRRTWPRGACRPAPRGRPEWRRTHKGRGTQGRGRGSGRLHRQAQGRAGGAAGAGGTVVGTRCWADGAWTEDW